MPPDQQPPEEPTPDYRVNFFRPRPGFMRQEVRIIWIMLAGWALFTFGYQLYLAFFRPEGTAGPTILGFPFHYWFTGQFLILWFILLCFVFNLLIDRLMMKHHKRR